MSGSRRKTKEAGKESADSERKLSRERPVSLDPLRFEDAIRGLFKVKPDKDVAERHATDRSERKDD